MPRLGLPIRITLEEMGINTSVAVADGECLSSAPTALPSPAPTPFSPIPTSSPTTIDTFGMCPPGELNGDALLPDGWMESLPLGYESWTQGTELPVVANEFGIGDLISVLKSGYKETYHV